MSSSTLPSFDPSLPSLDSLLPQLQWQRIKLIIPPAERDEVEHQIDHGLLDELTTLHESCHAMFSLVACPPSLHSSPSLNLHLPSILHNIQLIMRCGYTLEDIEKRVKRVRHMTD